jgi:RNA-directed DNA polymerase
MQLLLFPEEDDNASIQIEELFESYLTCRKLKRNTANALAFEVDYEQNLIDLCEEINNGTYRPGKSIAFIVNQPVKREIFAADFRDRVVHHLLINKLNHLFEKEFIYDSYACRVNKGTHFGINRIDRFIRQCSMNYTRDCYILKMDIKGLPPDKSLFCSPENCGLPIGNLTSQVFANFYLNSLDHFIKHKLKIRYYGRYVDDFVLVHEDKEYLKSIIPVIRSFLQNDLHLKLHPKKIMLHHYQKGVKYLGAFIKPGRIYIANRRKGNFYNAIQKHNAVVRSHKPIKTEKDSFLSSMNSYLGIMKHYKTYTLRKNIISKYISAWWLNYFYLSGGIKKFSKRLKIVK